MINTHGMWRSIWRENSRRKNVKQIGCIAPGAWLRYAPAHLQDIAIHPENLSVYFDGSQSSGRRRGLRSTSQNKGERHKMSGVPFRQQKAVLD